MRTIAPAIALGNSVVHKPDSQTALAGGTIIAKAFEYAGLPKGVFNCILTDLEEIGDAMLESPHSQLISFTGSTPVGKHIGKIAGSMLKRVALELGGNNPFILLKDGNVDQAVDAAIFGKFIHQGQICMSINRFIIHQNHYDKFVEKFVERVKEIPCGDPTDPKTIVGPLINEEQADKAMKIIDDAKEAGVKIALEGKREGNLITPFVFIDVENDSELAQTELFSPIATIIKADSEEHAIELANDTPFGLSSAIFTEDLTEGE
ncbi:aldehyde dehydrogenase (NAD+) [Piscibacillus halophilus]|uniref:Aldehyde dehydrogenase (NAD+) n=1 Tax=Piscibacillus halophilus TaxID=571933 RepID=A0A1H9C122_9BACI|nr:aldehyde dehydrogenase (NAD+) [Piscibacillus halophilus]